MRFSFLRIGAFLATLSVMALGMAQTTVPAQPQGTVRVMTYNIQWFHQGDGLERIKNLKEVMAEIRPNVLGFQETQGRAAIMQILDDTWNVGIIDDADEPQKLGIAVKAPYKLVDWEMLFTSPALNFAFPGKRDVLRATVETPQGLRMSVYVLHQKSRSGGRRQTDTQREMAAGIVAGYIAARGDNNAVVMGDMNDAPNDRSMNILESGDVMAKGGPRGEYRLLANLTEELADKDHVTIGMEDLYNGGPAISTIVPGAKAENDRLRGLDYRFPQDVKITQTFFDQILTSPHMLVAGNKAHVYGGVAAMRGLRGRVRVGEDPNTGTRTVQYTEKGTLASDHLPVFADVTLRR